MDRLQRSSDPEIQQREMLDAFRAGVWTAMPGIIESFDPDLQTCSVQPALRVPSWGKDLVDLSTALTVLTDCPVYFPAGGGCTLTFPVAKGDECWIVWGCRNIDSWWQSGGVQDVADRSMHDVADAAVFVGMRSKPRALSAVSTSSTQLRSDDGATFIDLNPGTQKVKIVAPGGFDVEAPLSNFSAAVTINGMLTWLAGMTGSTTATGAAAAVITGIVRYVGQVWVNGKRVDDTHTHSDPQGGNTGQVN